MTDPQRSTSAGKTAIGIGVGLVILGLSTLVLSGQPDSLQLVLAMAPVMLGYVVARWGVHRLAERDPREQHPLGKPARREDDDRE